MKSHPKVAVVTPVYNTAEYLAECIESVLAQSFGDFEYLIVDNASTDDSLSIAREFERVDHRVRVTHCDDHLPQIPNYNRAAGLANADAKYCKFLQADDALFPRCLEDMVSLGDQDDAITVVGGYSLSQYFVFLDGLDYYDRILDGKELCRRYFRGGRYIFGNPTTSMLRMDFVQSREELYPTDSLISDTELICEALVTGKFAHTHQVGCLVRRRQDSITHSRRDFDMDTVTRRVLLEKYGHLCLHEQELAKLRRLYQRRHERVLADGILTFKSARFWEFHNSLMRYAGLEKNRTMLGIACVVVVIRWLANLETTVRRAYASLRAVIQNRT